MNPPPGAELEVALGSESIASCIPAVNVPEVHGPNQLVSPLAGGEREITLVADVAKLVARLDEMLHIWGFMWRVCRGPVADAVDAHVAHVKDAAGIRKHTEDVLLLACDT